MKLFDFLKKDRESDILKSLISDDLTTPAQMMVNLREVCKRKTTLIVTIDDGPSTFRTMLLETGKENEPVIIDTLMPKHGNQFIESSNGIKIDYNLEGTMYSFQTKYIEMMSGRFTAIKIAFPSIIKKIQKRNSYRVSPPIDKPIIVTILKGVTEEVADISEGGLSFYSRNSANKLSIGTVLERVSFELPTIDRHIETSAVVRTFIKGSRGTVKNRYGIEFINMNMPDKDSIANYALVRQIETIRKKMS
ncbi:MAG: flagellar brake protein [Nitrospinae bacterium]|nr:flagellar brake protein [Nitrospinota bacterium]